jgi:hypothetical protein
MSNFMVACVDKYKQIVGGNVTFKHAATPFLSENEVPDHEWTAPGALADGAVSILMKILFGARAERWDLLRQVCYLAGFVSKWMIGHDRLLFRLMCYIHSTVELNLYSIIDSPSSTWYVEVYSDSDLGGCFITKRSTSGIIAGIVSTESELTWGHLTASSHKQGGTEKIGVADNTPEAEVVAANKANKCEVIPLQEIMMKILGRPVNVVHLVDNESALKMCKKGYSPALRHLPRQDGLSLARMKEQYFNEADNNLAMKYAPTAKMRADCFTKAFKSVAEWKEKLIQLRMFRGLDEVKDFIARFGKALARSECHR